jgi:hypothetical protein
LAAAEIIDLGKDNRDIPTTKQKITANDLSIIKNREVIIWTEKGAG